VLSSDNARSPALWPGFGAAKAVIATIPSSSPHSKNPNPPGIMGLICIVLGCNFPLRAWPNMN